MPADPYNPTPAEQTAIDEALDAYYRMGDSVTIDPPAIDGYITPEPQTFVLGAADNTFSYVYTRPSTGTGGGTASPTADDQLAQTGLSLWFIAGLAALAMTMGLASLVLTNRTRGGIRL